MDLVLTEDFFPKIGGAHLWLYEVYRRWPTPVQLLTQRDDQSPEEVRAAVEFDARDHGALEIVRRDIASGDIDLFSACSRRRFWRTSSEILELANRRPLTVHCLRAFPEGCSALLVKFRSPLRTRLVTFAHGEEILVARSSGQLRHLAALVYRWSDVVIANSRSTQSLVRELAPHAKVVYVHPGVDIAAYHRDPGEIERFRRQWKWPEGTLVVTTVARMEPRKNQASVIRAIARLRREGLQLAYVCGGDGEERKRLTQLSSELALDAWVRFTGRLTENEKVLTFMAADIHAMPSIRVGEMIEGFGIVFLESSAAGIPSIAGNVGGQSEAVIHGKTGLVVDGADVSAVTDAVRTLSLDSTLRRQMGQAARNWAEHHDWAGVFEAIFESCEIGSVK